MSVICKNCSENLISNFCANCGQKKYSRIDNKYIFDELQYTFLHLNKGFLFTVKNTFKNPGKTAKEFIDGKRVNHYKPILLLFVLSGISTFISFKIIDLKEIMTLYYAKQNIDSVQKANVMTNIFTFITDYNTLIMAAFVPFLAFATKISFKKMGHNYYEHVIMNTFLLSFYILVNFILVYPLMYFFKTSPSLIVSISGYSSLLFPIIYFLFFKEFYKSESLKSIFLRVLSVIGLIVIQYFLIILIIVIFTALLIKT